MAVLSLSARRLLDRLEIELADHGGTDNGRLVVTYEDFVRFGMDRHCVAPAIREVEALGLVEITEKGTGGNREYRRPSRYRLTYRHTNHCLPTDDWQSIKTLAEAKTKGRAARSFEGEQKQKTGVGISPFSVPETPTENSKAPVL